MSNFIKVNKNFKIPEKIYGEINKIWLYNSSEEAIDRAREKAPYLTWRLKAWIWREPAIVTNTTPRVIIWPRKIEYAIKREFSNKKNPQRRFYMKRTYDELPSVVYDEFNNATQIILKKYKLIK